MKLNEICDEAFGTPPEQLGVRDITVLILYAPQVQMSDFHIILKMNKLI